MKIFEVVESFELNNVEVTESKGLYSQYGDARTAMYQFADELAKMIQSQVDEHRWSVEREDCVADNREWALVHIIDLDLEYNNVDESYMFRIVERELI